MPTTAATRTTALGTDVVILNEHPVSYLDEVQSRLKRLSRTVKMHGFRPGKVPMKVVAQQYGPQVRQEVSGRERSQSHARAAGSRFASS